MTNSQRWAIWLLVAVVVFLVGAFMGGAWLAVVVYALARIAASMGWMAVFALVVGASRKRSG
jgi:hypothetical protein